MSQRNAAIAIALAIVMTVPVILAADPVGAGQQTALDANLVNDGPEGLNEVQGDWEFINEYHRLYFRRAPAMDHQHAQEGCNGCGATQTTFFDQSDDTNGFTWPYAVVPNDFTLNRMDVSAFLSSSTPGVIRFALHDAGTAIPGAWVEVDMSGFQSPDIPGLAVGGVEYSQVTGTRVIDPPIEIPEGTDLEVVVSIPNPALQQGPAFMRYDGTGARSQVGLGGEILHLNAWTENINGVAQDLFPLADVAPPEDRTIVMQGTQLSGLGSDSFQVEPRFGGHRHQIAVYGPDMTLAPADRSPDDVLLYTSSGANPNIFTMFPENPRYEWASGLMQNEWAIHYPATYDGSGKHMIRSSADGQGWTEDIFFTIGGGILEIDPAPFEQVAKTILEGEETQFHMTVVNKGTTPDTALIQVPANLDGWTASAAPTSFQLQAGGSQQVVVTVTPSPSAFAPEFKVFDVKAISSVSSSIDAEALTVTLTATPAHGIDLLKEASGIKVAPGQTKVIPITVQNTGNLREPVALSTSGTPLGWTTTIQPTQMDLGARVQNNALLSVTAPPDAKSGDVFTVSVKGVAINDNTVKDLLPVPVEVFFEDQLVFGLFGGKDPVTGLPLVVNPNGADLAAAYGATASTFGAHKLRDEGPDATGPPDGLVESTEWGITGFVYPGGYYDDVDNQGDHSYDTSSMYRLMLVNNGDRDDVIQIFPKEVRDDPAFSNFGYKDDDECEEPSDSGSAGDGRNDGWRFRLFDPITGDGPAALQPYGNAGKERNGDITGTPAGGEVTIDGRPPITVTVGAHETRYVYAEIGWVPPQDNGSGCDSSWQGFEADGARESDPARGSVPALIKAVSTNSPSQQQTVLVHAELLPTPNENTRRLAPDVYVDQHNAVFIHLETDAGVVPADEQGGFKGIPQTGPLAARTETYHVRVVNAGNEVDTLRIFVPSNVDGWTADIDNFGIWESLVIQPNYVNQKGGGYASTFPTGAKCTAPATMNAGTSIERRYVDCTMGSWDEVSVPVTLTVRDGEAIGVRKTIPVTVQSLDSLVNAGNSGACGPRAPCNVIEDAVRITGEAIGSYAFELVADDVLGVVDVDIVAGESVLVPYTIRNYGTNGDNFNMDIAVEPVADAGWNADLASSSPLFVPGESSYEGFLAISAPDNAVTGASENFRVKIQSMDTPVQPGQVPPTRVVNVQVEVVDDQPALTASGDPPEVLGLIGTPVTFDVQATRVSGTLADVQFRLLDEKLPTGWTLTGPDMVGPMQFDASGDAMASFTVNVPSKAIGSSRAVVQLVAEDLDLTGNVVNSHPFYVVINLDASNFGVLLQNPDDFAAATIDAIVVAGSSVTIPVRVQNLAAGVDQIDLSHSTLSSGWSLQFSEDPVSVQPRQAKEVTVEVGAPAGLGPGEGRDILLTGTSTKDPSRSHSITLRVSTGNSVLEISNPAADRMYMAPEETVTYTFQVMNNGTVRDNLKLSSMMSPAYRDVVTTSFSPATLNLGPGEVGTASMIVKAPAGIVPNSVVPIDFQAESDGTLLNTFGKKTVEVRILDYRATDIDNDGNDEYAIDRDRQRANGMEAFADPRPTGIPAASLRMVDFMTDEAREGYVAETTIDNETVTVFTFRFDLNKDGRVDHFVDIDQDGLPDVYWDPFTGAIDELGPGKDVTGDGIREYFVDVNGDNLLDVWYDLTTGKSGALLQVDVDGDDTVDFVVDLNDNGIYDDGEPVLFGKDGVITKITQLVDMNGDGKLDLVVDEDGDGVWDYFIPNGKNRGVPIVMEDVNGDGVEDWTYDANNDGKRDSYYDPVTGKSGSIDAGNAFLEGLTTYWYVPALFALVSVLFVVLVVVTRR